MPVFDRDTAEAPGILGSFRALGDGLVGALHNRIELLSVELQEEKYRLMQVFLWIAAAVFSAVMAITFATLAFVYFFWETARLGVLVGLGVFYTLAFVGVVIGFRRYLARQPRPFAATLGELEEDRACFRTKS